MRLFFVRRQSPHLRPTASLFPQIQTQAWVIGLLLALVMGAPLPCQAARFYVDWQNGLSQFRSVDQLMGQGEGAASGLGFSAGLGIFMSPLSSVRRFDLQIGLSLDALTGSQGTLGLGLATPFFVARLQYSFFYLSGGVSPFVYSRAVEGGSPFGFDGFIRNPGNVAVLAEAGILYGMTPKYSLGLSLTPRVFYKEGAWLLNPSSSIRLVMRFYWGLPNRGGSSSDSSFEYDGWRYIGK